MPQVWSQSPLFLSEARFVSPVLNHLYLCLVFVSTSSTLIDATERHEDQHLLRLFHQHSYHWFSLKLLQDGDDRVQTFGKRCRAAKRDPNCPVVIRGWLNKKVLFSKQNIHDHVLITAR